MLHNLFLTISLKGKYNRYIHHTYKGDKEKLSNFSKVGPRWRSTAGSLTTEAELIISIWSTPCIGKAANQMTKMFSFQ